VESLRPWAIINAAGYVQVDEAEVNTERCYRENVVGPVALAKVCQEHGIRMMTFSSDLVFNGMQRQPYCEKDCVGPLSYYGHTKAEADCRILAINPAAVTIRTSAFFGPWDEYNFAISALRQLRSGQPLRVAGDQVVSPTYLPDLVNTCLDLLIDGVAGVWHVANTGAATWFELATQLATLARIDNGLIEECSTKELQLAAPRPVYSALGTERGCLLPHLEEALPRFVREASVLQSLV